MHLRTHAYTHDDTPTPTHAHARHCQLPRVMNRLKISTRLAISFSTMVLLLVAQGAMVLFLSAAQR